MPLVFETKYDRRGPRLFPGMVTFDYCGILSESASRLRQRSDDLTAERARFSQAHELAHRILGQLEGSTGSGKTHMAASLFNQLSWRRGSTARPRSCGARPAARRLPGAHPRRRPPLAAGNGQRGRGAAKLRSGPTSAGTSSKPRPATCSCGRRTGVAPVTCMTAPAG